VRGDLLLKTIDGHPAGEEKRTAEEAAERCYREAIDCAGRMGAKAFHLRAATCLGRLLHASGRSAEARALLTPVHASFSEGFGTRDLKEARALSEALARSSAG
jgi:predicted ATPase